MNNIMLAEELERSAKLHKLEKQLEKTKKKKYDETHFQGTISIEQKMKPGILYGDLGVQISEDGRVWICLNGQALIRLVPRRK